MNTFVNSTTIVSLYHSDLVIKLTCNLVSPTSNYGIGFTL